MKTCFGHARFATHMQHNWAADAKQVHPTLPGSVGPGQIQSMVALVLLQQSFDLASSQSGR